MRQLLLLDRVQLTTQLLTRHLLLRLPAGSFWDRSLNGGGVAVRLYYGVNGLETSQPNQFRC